MTDHRIIEHANNWIELSRSALLHNATTFRRLIGRDIALMAVVKANAYGHGMLPVAKTVVESCVDWLGVFTTVEGIALREAGINVPILVLGATLREQIDGAVEAGLRLSIMSTSGVRDLLDHPSCARVPVHIKLETGTNRQGLLSRELPETIALLRNAGVAIEGAYTHFADIEDTTDHTFAAGQIDRFGALLEQLDVTIPIPHTACTAATILFPNTHFSMVRVGIGLFGLWPSKETQVSATSLKRNGLDLTPVMTWKTRIAQIKDVPAGDYVGYGRTFRATRHSRIAVLPVGYADGYDRNLSSGAHTLLRGTRAPVVGRICMNLTMVDVTDVAQARAGDEVILLGAQGDESVSAEDLARLADTINYEIVTRAAPGSPRILVP
jgi:alanine racemase